MPLEQIRTRIPLWPTRDSAFMKSCQSVRCIILCAALSSCLGDLTSAAEAPETSAFFEKEIAPILKQRCYECHSHEGGKAMGGLVLDSRRGWETA
jgi:hypothetical protein